MERFRKLRRVNMANQPFIIRKRQEFRVKERRGPVRIHPSSFSVFPRNCQHAHRVPPLVKVETDWNLASSMGSPYDEGLLPRYVGISLFSLTPP